MKVTFSYNICNRYGWTRIAGEILILKPLVFFHLKNFFLFKTEKDKEEAMDPAVSALTQANLEYNYTSCVALFMLQ